MRTVRMRRGKVRAKAFYSMRRPADCNPSDFVFLHQHTDVTEIDQNIGWVLYQANV